MRLRSGLRPADGRAAQDARGMEAPSTEPLLLASVVGAAIGIPLDIFCMALFVVATVTDSRNHPPVRMPAVSPS